jgi:hypothetical protein
MAASSPLDKQAVDEAAKVHLFEGGIEQQACRRGAAAAGRTSSSSSAPAVRA